MKILIYSDVHWSTNSSLIRSRGNTFSTRLEHLIQSMNWVNKLAMDENCDCMICAGDFMDKAQLTDEEITALQTIKWNNLKNYFLCGNHESSVSDLRYSSLKAVESDNHIIIDKLFVLHLADCDILFLPYIVESDRKALKEYLADTELANTNKPLIIVSHNDIAGINYAGFESKIGFSVKEIEENCDLYLNGHLHNSEWITKKVLNVGSLSAHNFTNDSSKYNYGAWILDTTTRNIQFINNPCGFNFYKFNMTVVNDLAVLDTLKNNAVLSIKCPEELMSPLKEKLNNLSNIIDSRLMLAKDLQSTNNEITIAALQTDHLSKFIEFCKTNIVNSAVLETELAEICK